MSVSYKVFVVNMRGNPLMPCTIVKARNLLKQKKAVVYKRYPFTIQLTIATGETKQDVTLGIDTGYGNIGFSAVSEKQELISGTLKLYGKTKERLDERRMYRRGRRNRLWYRKPRFLNRGIPRGWLPPSIERRYQTHLTLIEKIKKLLLITKVIVEVAKFDIQKLENPEIKGKEYQQGNMYEYQNIRSYLMSREKGLCEHCKKDFINNPSHIHHRKLKSKKGCNRLENLMLIHKKCHDVIHKNPKLLKKYEKSSVKEYKQSAFMNIINKRFYKDIPDLKVTYGNITFVNRNKLGLKKSHTNDAFVIANGVIQGRCKEFLIEQKRRHNRTLQLNRKGFKPSIRKQRYKYQPKDLVWIGSKKYNVSGVQNKGNYIKVQNCKKVFSIKLIEKFFNFGSFVWNI